MQEYMREYSDTEKRDVGLRQPGAAVGMMMGGGPNHASQKVERETSIIGEHQDRLTAEISMLRDSLGVLISRLAPVVADVPLEAPEKRPSPPTGSPIGGVISGAASEIEDIRNIVIALTRSLEI